MVFRGIVGLEACGAKVTRGEKSHNAGDVVEMRLSMLFHHVDVEGVSFVVLVTDHSYEFVAHHGADDENSDLQNIFECLDFDDGRWTIGSHAR
jgi:hypothetical protein